MVNIGDFQNTPQNGDTGHDNDKHLAGGQRCSRFVPVHGLFTFCSKVGEQRVNKSGTLLFTVCSRSGKTMRVTTRDNACTYTVTMRVTAYNIACIYTLFQGFCTLE